jgi:hypothetical protein
MTWRCAHNNFKMIFSILQELKRYFFGDIKEFNSNQFKINTNTLDIFRDQHEKQHFESRLSKTKYNTYFCFCDHKTFILFKFCLVNLIFISRFRE